MLVQALRTTIFLVCTFLALTVSSSAETPKFAKQITIDHGLAQSTVSSIYQAHDGRLWFATGDGISIYDGKGFENIYRSEEPDRGLQNNYISQIKEGPSGRIWVATLGGGLTILSQTGEFLRGYRSPIGDASTNDVYDFAWDEDGHAWVATAGGVFHLEPQQTDSSKELSALSVSVSKISSRAVEMLTTGELLIGTRTEGLVVFNPVTLESTSITTQSSGLSGSRIMDLFQDSGGNVWVGTEDGGLNQFEPQSGIITQPIDLPDSDIESISEGPDGRLWFGSWSNGVFVYDPETEEIENYRSRSGKLQRLSSNTVVALHPGRTGYMWIGTYDGGVNRVGLYPDSFATYFADQKGETGPTTGVIWSIADGQEGDVWVGSKDGLSRFWPSDHRFEIIDLGAGRKDVRAILPRGDVLLLAVRGRGLLRYNWQTGELSEVLGLEGLNLFDGVYIRLLLQDQSQNIWVGTHSGVYRLSPNLQIDLHLSTTTPQKLPHDRVRSLYKDRDGSIWIGTSGGLSRFDASAETLSSYSGPSYFDDNDVRAVWRHPNGQLFVGTQAGFSILDEDMKLIRHVQRKDGMPNETLYSLLPDADGQLWMMTNNGLVRYDPELETLDVFRTRDGLQGAEFNFNAYARLGDDRIAVGGINGLSVFHPRELSRNLTEPVVSLTSMQSSDGVVAPATLQFNATVSHFSEPDQNMLRWKLEPIDDDWREASGTTHELIRENLAAGDYTLVYQGLSAAGVASKVQSTSFKITQPPYLRWYAFVAYALAMFGVLYLALRLRTGRLLRQKLALERVVSKKTEELTTAHAELSVAYKEKSKFYARTAHEIRTPVSLIKAPLQSVIDSQTLTTKNLSLLRLVNRAVDRLARLTDEMADVAANGYEVAITASSIDVPAFVEPILELYQNTAQAKGLSFDAQLTFDGAATIDAEAFELILHNLLSNAVNHTKTKDTVQVRVGASEDMITVVVSNDGDLPETTVQALTELSSNKLPQRGVEIVGAMAARTNGKIHVQQRPARIEVEIPAHVSLTKAEIQLPSLKTHEACILVVEDDRDLRGYLNSALEELGSVHSVASIAAARRALQTRVFNLILCDVMLPDGSGFDLIKETKEDGNTSHIPAIFLTALSDVASQKKGLEAWGDDYLTKPFDLNELKSKVEIRLRSIEAIRTHLRGNMPHTQEEEQVPLAPADERLVARIEEAVASRLSETNFSVDDMAKHCAMSKRSLQRKLDALYGLTFTELLGQRRMERASTMLRSGISVNEVCIACGYSHPSSFSRRFKQHFGLLPSEYKDGSQDDL